MTFTALALALLIPGPALDDATGHFQVRPETVSVGEPFELVLDVLHDNADVVTLADEPDLDPSWVLLDARREPAAPAGEGRTRTRYVWTLASLDPGARPVDEPWRDAIASLGVQVSDVSPSIEVVGVLGDEEDEPRPMQGIPSSFGDGLVTAQTNWWPLVLGGGAAGLLAAAFAGWMLGRRGRPATEVRRSPLEELTALRGSANAGPEALRDSHFELARLLRQTTDRALSREARDGKTDEEWLATLAGESSLASEVRDDMARVLERCTAARYAGDRPTEWALEETFTAARRALERLASLEPTGGAAR